MITKHTAYEIVCLYQEIEAAEDLLQKLITAKRDGEIPDIRDHFGRQRSLELGVPSGDTSQRLFKVDPELAIQIIKAHIAQKQAALNILGITARGELDGTSTAEPESHHETT